MGNGGEGTEQRGWLYLPEISILPHLRLDKVLGLDISPDDPQPVQPLADLNNLIRGTKQRT